MCRAMEPEVTRASRRIFCHCCFFVVVVVVLCVTIIHTKVFLVRFGVSLILHAPLPVEEFLGCMVVVEMPGMKLNRSSEKRY